MEDERSWCCAQDDIFVFKPSSSWSFLCVEDSKKKISKDKKNQPKAQERELLHASFLDSILYTRTHLYICAFKTSDRKTLSFYSVSFSFVGVHCFITKTDIYYIECSFFLISCVYFFHLFLLQKKEANFSLVSSLKIQKNNQKHKREKSTNFLWHERNVTPQKPHDVKKWHHHRRRSRKRRR